MNAKFAISMPPGPEGRPSSMIPTKDDLFRAGPSRTAKEYLWKAIFSNDKARDADHMAKYIVPGTCVIDVGSHVGYFSRRFADKNPGGMVVAFEPQSVPRSIATVASFFRRQRNIVQLPLALGCSPGLVELKIPIKASGDIGIGLAHIGAEDDLKDRFTVRREIASRETLDNVMSHLTIERMSLIKIDVEGGELDVVRGASATLDRYRPVVVCETTGAMKRFGDSVASLRAFMVEKGYVAVDLLTGHELGPEDSATDTAFIPRGHANGAPAP
jgi:FkbM family methyltransferase